MGRRINKDQGGKLINYKLKNIGMANYLEK